MSVRRRFLACAIAFIPAGPLLGQAAGAGVPATNGQIVLSVLGSLEKRVLDLADAMPAEKYSFAPSGGEFRDVRTFGEQLKHIAADLYLDGARILGESTPGDVGSGESGSATVQTKAQTLSSQAAY